jgi:hypothetical protein
MRNVIYLPNSEKTDTNLLNDFVLANKPIDMLSGIHLAGDQSVVYEPGLIWNSFVSSFQRKILCNL